jgi:hypothetical protein
MTRIRELGADGSSWTGSSCSVVAGSSPTGSVLPADPMRRPLGCRPGRMGSCRRSRPHACSRRNSVQVGADPAWCRAEAALAKHRGDGGVRDVDAELQSSPRILRYPHLGFPRPNRRISSLIAGSRRGRPGRQHGPRGRLHKELSVPSEEGVRADQEAPPPAPGEQPGRRGHNARSAVVKRGRVPPRARIFSWRRSTTASRSRSSTPQRTSRRSRPQRSQYLRNRSIGQRLTSGRTAGERRCQSTDRVSLPHTLIAVAHAGESRGLRPSDPAPRLNAE